MLKKLLRFKNLKERNYANSRNQLEVLIREYGFPPGKYLSDRVRVWEEDSVISWYESRPSADGSEPDPSVDLNNNISDKPAAITPARRRPSSDTAKYEADTAELHDP
jgi:hypothetical protein